MKVILKQMEKCLILGKPDTITNIIEHPAFVCRLMIRQRIHARIRYKFVNLIVLGANDSKKGFTDKLSKA